MQYSSHIHIINNSSLSWVEIRQKSKYNCLRKDKCPLLKPHSQVDLIFAPHIGMFHAPMGVGADSWFQSRDGKQEFLLHWKIPPLNVKPQARVI